MVVVCKPILVSRNLNTNIIIDGTKQQSKQLKVIVRISECKYPDIKVLGRIYLTRCCGNSRHRNLLLNLFGNFRKHGDGNVNNVCR